MTGFRVAEEFFKDKGAFILNTRRINVIKSNEANMWQRNFARVNMTFNRRSPPSAETGPKPMLSSGAPAIRGPYPIEIITTSLSSP